MSGTSKRPVLRHFINAVEIVDDILAREQCLTILHQKQELTQTMCSPGRERDLVLGYLLTQGLINKIQDVKEIYFSTPGRESVQAVVHLQKTNAPLRSRPCTDINFEADHIFDLMEQMKKSQEIFQRTGATHSAALFNRAGRRLSLAEDIGRHNALDKVIGDALAGQELDQAVAATITSRLSCELVAKSVAAGLAFLCGISVATTSAVDLAEKKGLTLIGRIRGGRMNVYTHKRRVLWGKIRSSPDKYSWNSAS